MQASRMTRPNSAQRTNRSARLLLQFDGSDFHVPAISNPLHFSNTAIAPQAEQPYADEFSCTTGEHCDDKDPESHGCERQAMCVVPPSEVNGAHKESRDHERCAHL